MALSEAETTIGSGKTYPDIDAWETATDIDCVTGETSPVGVLYDTADYDEGAIVTFAGATTSADYHRRLTVAAGERHAGVLGAGVLVTHYALEIAEGYFQLEWVQIQGATVVSAYANLNVSAGQDVKVRNCFIDAAAVGGYVAMVAKPGDTTDMVVENCILITRLNHASADVLACGYQDGVIVRNCTGLALGATAGMSGIDYGSPTNCIAITNGAAGAYTNSDGGDWNIGSDTTAPGANSDQYDNTAAATLFVDLTGGAENLHLKPALDGTYEGTSLAAYFTDDIDADTRSDWDIGADEISGGAPAGDAVPVCWQSYRARRVG